MKYTSGSIVLVKFPFADLTTIKKRPALILKAVSHGDKFVIYQIAMVTSKVDSLKLEGDFLVQEWKKSGLLHPSVLRLSKIATVEESLIDKELGKLSLSDKKQVSKLFSKFYSIWL